MSVPAGRPHLGQTMMSARPLSEYRAMFELTDDDLLAGPVLDCPGGGASFAAEARALGADVLSVDPLYAATPAELADRTLLDTHRSSDFIGENLERYVWTFFRSQGHHLEHRRGGAQLFAQDIVAHPEHYVAAELPELPFEDGWFRLALSSHLLFTYADRLDFEFHLAALGELARVASEVRAYPLVDYGAHPYPEMDQLRARLQDRGIATEIRVVSYEFQRGANRMLVLTS